MSDAGINNKESGHICIIYKSESEWQQSVIPFLKEGIEKNQKVIYIYYDHSPEQILSLLNSQINDKRKIESHLTFISVHDTYVQNNEFFADRMIQRLVEEINNALSEGYKALRVTGETGWLNEEIAHKFLEYEIRIENEIFNKYPCIAFCQFNWERFSPCFLEAIVRTHPFIVWKNSLLRNLFHVRQDEISEEKSHKLWLERILDFIKKEELFKTEETELKSLLFHQSYLGLAIAISFPPKIVMINRGFREILGYDEIEIVNMSSKKFLELVHEEDRSQFIEDYEEVFSKKTNNVNRRYRFLNSKGDLVCLRMLMSSTDFLDSKAVILSFIDVTEQWVQEQEMRQLREQFLHAQKMESIGRLAAGIAHDFNNILTAIKGFADLANLRILESDPIKSYLESIQISANRAERLVKNLLAFSKHQILSSRRMNLNELIRNIEEMLKRIVREDIIILTNLSPVLNDIEADPTQIEQVIVNLIVNAKDAIPKGGSIVIETSNVEIDSNYVRQNLGFEEGSYVLLSISDTGVGIPSEIKDKIFEPFFTTKREKGTGLGLSTVYGIVKQHGGNINVYSEPGRGTTFKIYLPAVKTQNMIIEETVERKEILTGNETILVIDDDENVRKVLVDILKRLGYHVLEAKDKDIALFFAQFYEKPIDLVITDIVMPSVDGVKLFEKIKRYKPQTKVLFMSGYPEDVTKKHGLSIQRKNFISKPFSIEEISNKIREILDNKNA